VKSTLVACCLLGCLTGLAQGQLIAYEGVQYFPGGLAGDGPAPGLPGFWIADGGVQVTLGTLSSSLALPSTGNSVSGFFDSVDQLGTPLIPAPGAEFWASFLLFHSGPNDQAYMGLSPGGAVLGNPPIAGFGVRLGQYGIFNGGTFFGSPTPFTPNGSTDFLVAHFQAGAGVWTESLFVNPTSFLFPSVVVNVPGITFGSMVNQNQAEFMSDEFRLGDTAGDVSPIPAPGATALLASLLLLRRRRR
jgi:hypothetical protein